MKYQPLPAFAKPPRLLSCHVDFTKATTITGTWLNLKLKSPRKLQAYSYFYTSTCFQSKLIVLS